MPVRAILCVQGTPCLHDQSKVEDVYKWPYSASVCDASYIHVAVHAMVGDHALVCIPATRPATLTSAVLAMLMCKSRISVRQGIANGQHS